MTRGTIVFSKAGRDKGMEMVVLEAEGEFLLLADGRRRTLEKPKRKKVKHIQPTNTQILMKPECGRALQDADIRKQLKVYMASRGISKQIQHASGVAHGGECVGER
ncbi:MAG: KOW domain-containing RNA-binding protein [Defluviitaleaceae bacterium]|nr:KOW domain-containing RNA-binding protein [Defluviitaleaceae bacterium]